MAVAHANCTTSSDLAGIYFAVQASYEQQRTASAIPNLPHGPGGPGKKPSG